MESIDIEMYISNISTKRLKISGLTVEKESLLLDSNEQYKIVLSPSHTHKISFSENCQKLNIFPNTVRIEYVLEESDLDQFSKAIFILPLLPVVKYNIESTAVPARINSLWDNLTYSWQEVISTKLYPDQEFFPNSKEILALLPNMSESEELETSQVPAEEVKSVSYRPNHLLAA